MPELNSNHPVDLAGRLAVVTGGASGIGYAIARRLAQAGSKVLVVDVDEDKLQEGRRSFGDDGLDFTPVFGDLSSQGTGRLADGLLADHGVIPLIVNNVGVCTGTGFYDTDEDRFDHVFSTNLRGPWFFTRRLTRELVRQGVSGSVLFLSSLHDRFVIYRPQYGVSKAGVSQLVRELASLLAPYRIRVNAISPGWIDTPGSQGSTEGRPEANVPRLEANDVVPLGRGGTPDDVAKAAVFLLSEALAGYITGANIPVDGGLALHTWHSPREPVFG